MYSYHTSLGDVVFGFLVVVVGFLVVLLLGFFVVVVVLGLVVGVVVGFDGSSGFGSGVIGATLQIPFTEFSVPLQISPLHSSKHPTYMIL